MHAIPKAPLLSGALADVPGFYCNASALPYPSTSGKLFQYLMPAQQQAPYVHRVGAPIPLLATAPDRDADNATVRCLHGGGGRVLEQSRMQGPALAALACALKPTLSRPHPRPPAGCRSSCCACRAGATLWPGARSPGWPPASCGLHLQPPAAACSISG